MVSRFRQRLAGRIERRRVAFADATRRVLIAPPRPALLVVRRSSRPSVLRQLEDRRTFHPQGAARPAAGFFVPRHRLVVRAPARRSVTVTGPGLGASPSQDFFSPPIGVGFQAPRQVAVCIRRKVRKQVMHAKGFAGGKVRRPRRTEYSGVIC